jgi:peptide/nickel transport system substrate-binding protein
MPTSLGAYQLKASWEGDTAYSGATSTAVSVNVVKISTTISCSVSPSEITEGSSITVSGSIDPAVSGKTVSLSFRKPDGTALTRTVTSDSHGSYNDSYKPDAAGSWSVTASWPGDPTHEGASSQPVSFTVKKSGCIIATATYGSELSPEVQFLRGFRDQLVLQTFAGSQFMELFNAWYYSFSPGVAGFISEHPVAKAITKALLYPLMGILHLSALTNSALSFNSEVGITAAGLVASSLIGAIYFSPPLTATLLISKHLRKAFKMDMIRLLSIPWMISILLIPIGEVTASPTLVTIATGIFVLTTLTLSASTVALGILKIRSRPEELKPWLQQC